MSLRSRLRVQTRQPEFLWKLALGMLAVGGMLAYAVQASPDIARDPRERMSHEQLAHWEQVEQLAVAGRWSDLWWAIPRGMWLAAAPGPTLLAVATGLCWFTFLLQAGQPHRPAGVRWWLAVLAVLLGALSIWPTRFAIYWQEYQWNLPEAVDLAGGLTFFILGVGLREELAKLLLFLPLAPWILRRRDEREALLVAGCVGLGFAVHENVNYFVANAGSSSGRFLTANFLHISFTGLAGLAVCRAIWSPRERAAESVAILLLLVIAHGMYDALIVLPAFAQYSMFSLMVFILLAYQFFHELRAWWQPPGEAVSLTATFIAAVSLVASLSLIYLSALEGFNTAVQAAMIPAVGLGVMVYMFLREMPESIIDV